MLIDLNGGNGQCFNIGGCFYFEDFFLLKVHVIKSGYFCWRINFALELCIGQLRRTDPGTLSLYFEPLSDDEDNI